MVPNAGLRFLHLDTLFSLTLIHVLFCPPSVHSYLQQFVEVFDMTFLDLLRGDLRLFEMDVFVVKCLEEERDTSY